MVSGFSELLFGHFFNRPHVDQLQFLDLLGIRLLQVSLRGDLGRSGRCHLAELLGQLLTLGVVGHDVFQLLDLGLQGHVRALQILNVLMLGLHRQDLEVELVCGPAGSAVLRIDCMTRGLGFRRDAVVRLGSFGAAAALPRWEEGLGRWTENCAVLILEFLLQIGH